MLFPRQITRQSLPGAFAEELERRALLSAAPVLVGDINTQSDQLDPTGPAVQVGKAAFFTAHPSAADGLELFKTDGTASGTVLVKDINAVDGSSPAGLTAAGNTLYFTADDGVTGRELWKSDGTAAGTVRLADLNAGSASSSPANLTSVNGTLYFTANDGSATRLYKLAGGAPTLVNDLTPGTAFSSVTALTALGNTLVLSALKNGVTSLYRADSAGATQITPADSSVQSLVAFNGSVYFTTRAGATVINLYRSDAVPGTPVLVKTISSDGSAYVLTNSFTVSGDRLYFRVSASNSSATDLWRTDGTSAGTFAVTNNGAITSGFAGTAFGTHLLLFSVTTAAEGTEPWVSDGTAAGTHLLKDLAPGAASGLGVYGGAVPIAGGKLLFVTASSVGVPTQIWTTDGTAANTSQTATVTAEYATVALGSLNGAALLSAVGLGNRGYLYRSDGTAAGTSRVNVPLGGNGSGVSNSAAAMPSFVSDGTNIFFGANDGVHGLELWKASAVAALTRLTDIAPGVVDSTPSLLTLAADESLYFSAKTSSIADAGIYRLAPGAASPTQIVAPDVGGHTRVSNFVTVGNTLYFTASGGSPSYAELWRYYPATGQAAAVKVGGYSLQTTRFVQAGGYAYFGAIESSAGGTLVAQRLFRIDSSPASTPQLVADISGGPSYLVAPVPIGAVRSTIYFTAATVAQGTELWKTSASGATLVADLTTGAGSSEFSVASKSSLEVNGQLYFIASTGPDYTENLWRTDGTSAGTVQIGGASQASTLAQTAGRVYFIGTADAARGVFRVDGASATRVTPVAAGDGAFVPTDITFAGTQVFVTGIGGANARYELWSADSAFGNFAKMATLAPYTRGSALIGFFNSGRYALTATAADVFFPMYAPATGLELYRLPLSTGGNISGVTFNDTNADGVQNAGESAGSGKTIFLDANNNGKLDSGELSVVTGVDGRFAFENLSPGSYHVRRIFPSGYASSTPPIDLTLTAGQAVGGLKIGSKSAAASPPPPPPPISGSLSGYAFNDSNKNGVLDSDEVKTAGKTVFLDTNNNGLLDGNEKSIVTGAGGSFSFAGLAAGTYHVRRVFPKGYTYSNQPIDVVLAGGQTRAGLAIGSKVG